MTTPKPRRVVTESSPFSPPSGTDADNSGPSVLVDSSTGKATCSRRGVHGHPDSCGQFVVCAPASRATKELQAFVHHCPADQVFVKDVGRCRPGNKERCEIFS